MIADRLGSDGVAARVVRVGIGTSGSKALLLMAELVIARRFGPDGLGLVALPQSLLMVFGSLAAMGLPLVVVREVGLARGRTTDSAADRTVKAGSLVAATSGLVASVVTVAALLVLDPGERRSAMMLATVGIPFEALNQVFAGALRGRRRMLESVVATDMLRNVSFFGAALVVPPRSGAMTIVGVYVASTAITSIVMTPRTFRLFHSLRLSEVRVADCKDVFRSSWLLLVWNALQVTSGRIQVLLAAAFLSDADLGILNLLLRTLLLLTFIQSAVNNAAPIEFAERRGADAHDGVKALYGRLVFALTIGGVVVSLPLVLGSNLAYSLVGAAFTGSAALLVPLVVAQFFNVATGPMGHVLVTYDEQRSLVVIAVLGAATQLTASLALTPVYGLAGAVAAETLTILVITFIRLVIGRRRVGIHALHPALIPAVAVLLGAALLRPEVAKLEQTSAVAGLLVCVSGSVVVAALIARFAPRPCSREISRAGMRTETAEAEL